jgi:hypothetical protein
VPDIFVAPSQTENQNVFSSSPKTENAPILKNAKPVKYSFFKHAISAYNFMPEGLKFQTQEDNEQVILLLRQHWITNVIWLATAVIFIILPIFLFPLIARVVTLPPVIPETVISVIAMIWYLFTFSYIIVNFLYWYFNIWIVTNERIIDIEFVNLLNKKFSATRISKIEDVSMHTSGFIGSLFEYGDVFVQTAATEAVFKISAVPTPEQVVRVVNNLMGKEEEANH